MSYRPFESTKRPRGTSDGAIDFIGLENRSWKGPEYTAWSVYNSLISQIDRNTLELIRSLDVDSSRSPRRVTMGQFSLLHSRVSSQRTKE